MRRYLAVCGLAAVVGVVGAFGFSPLLKVPFAKQGEPRVISVFAVRFEHSPHPNPPRGRGGSRGSSPVHGGGWEGGMLKNQRKDTYYQGGKGGEGKRPHLPQRFRT